MASADPGPRGMALRTLAALAFFAIAAGAFQPYYWKMFTIPRSAMRNWMVELPYSKMPGLRRFMSGVRDRTRNGDAIAIAIPAPAWEKGYQYGFTRSTYLLAGRTTVPLMGEDDRRLPWNVERANYVACWHSSPAIPHFAVAWRTADGVLLRRVE